MAGLAITAAATVWLSLLVRKALLLVAVVFAPLAFSGASWDASRGWIGKWAMFVVALICSKLVLVVMFLVAITQVSAPIDADLASVSDPIAGIVLMAMAAFAPYLTYKFIASVGFDMYHAIGSEQDAKSAFNRPIPVRFKLQGGDPKKVLDGTGGSGNSGGSSGSGGSTPPPPKTPAPAPAASGSGAAGGGGAAAGGGGAAAAGPVAAGVVIGASAAKGAATAGPKAGTALGAQGEHAADAAAQTPPPPAASTAAPPSSPAPRTPNADPSPPPSKQPSRPRHAHRRSRR